MQKFQYSFSVPRALGALLVAFSLQPCHSQTGPPVLARRSLSGFTRILSNNESVLVLSDFMTGHYALSRVTASSLDCAAISLIHGNMRTADTIAQKLTEAFVPQSL